MGIIVGGGPAGLSAALVLGRSRRKVLVVDAGNPRNARSMAMHGYLSRDGSLDLNILIRTVVTDGGELTLRAGAGIVADSEPERELAETRAKAKGLLLALGQDQP